MFFPTSHKVFRRVLLMVSLGHQPEDMSATKQCLEFVLRLEWCAVDLGLMFQMYSLYFSIKNCGLLLTSFSMKNLVFLMSFHITFRLLMPLNLLCN